MSRMESLKDKMLIESADCKRGIIVYYYYFFNKSIFENTPERRNRGVEQMFYLKGLIRTLASFSDHYNAEKEKLPLYIIQLNTNNSKPEQVQ
jgi:hypothetical protein